MCMAVIGILGGVMSGIGAAMQAKQQEKSLKAQSDMEKRQASIEAQAGNYKARQQQAEGERVLGQQRAAFAANGVALDGTALDVIGDTAGEIAMDTAAIRWNSSLTSENLRYKSKVSAMNAKSAGAAAPIAFLTPVLGSLAQFGSSFGAAA